MMRIGYTTPQIARPKFGAHLLPDDDFYNDSYRIEKNFNGENAEPFLIDEITQLFPNNDAYIWDIGSGDGRNILPLIALGNSGVASEMCSSGRDRIQKRINNDGLHSRLTVDAQDILQDSPSGKRFFDFTMMSRVSQHFNEAEMRTALTNVYSQLKNGGYFAFDAFIRKPGFESIQSTSYEENLGRAHFAWSTIEQIAKDLGFNVIKIKSFKKPLGQNPRYLDSSGWNNTRLQHQWILLQK